MYRGSHLPPNSGPWNARAFFEDFYGNCQIPPDLVVKTQAIDIFEVIL
jgi:hypothetical protein